MNKHYIYQKKLNGKSIGIVFGSFSPLHEGHIDLIMKAKKENNGGCIVIVCGYDGDKGEPKLPHSKRYQFVREYFADDDLVSVYAINDTELGIVKYPNGWNEWMEEFDNIWKVATKNYYTSRVWYVGDKDYYDGLIFRHEKAILVDRSINPISATMIRENPIKYWDKIATTFRRVYSKNILITGTASEGKTTLVQDLGKYFNTSYSYEYAREYLEVNHIHETEVDTYDFKNFLIGQHELNKKMINSPLNKGVFFADTDSLVTSMYAQYYVYDENFKLDNVSSIVALAVKLSSLCQWDKIFLIKPHGIFVDDNSRYMGHSELDTRQRLFDILYDNLKGCNLLDKVVLLDGDYYENFCTIKDYVRKEVFNYD